MSGMVTKKTRLPRFGCYLCNMTIHTSSSILLYLAISRLRVLTIIMARIPADRNHLCHRGVSWGIVIFGPFR